MYEIIKSNNHSNINTDNISSNLLLQCKNDINILNDQIDYINKIVYIKQNKFDNLINFKKKYIYDISLCNNHNKIIKNIYNKNINIKIYIFQILSYILIFVIILYLL